LVITLTLVIILAALVVRALVMIVIMALIALVSAGAVVRSGAGAMVIARATRSMILPTVITARTLTRAGTVIRARTGAMIRARTVIRPRAGTGTGPVARPGMVIARAAAWAAEAVLIIAARQATGEHCANRDLGEHLFHATEMVGAFQCANPNA
jgi:hypothetical protein